MHTIRTCFVYLFQAVCLLVATAFGEEINLVLRPVLLGHFVVRHWRAERVNSASSFLFACMSVNTSCP